MKEYSVWIDEAEKIVSFHEVDNSELIYFDQREIYLAYLMLDVLESGPDWMDDFDEQLFSDLVETIVVVDNEKLCFRLLNGLEVTEKIERTQR